jgi:hypothetical protein
MPTLYATYGWTAGASSFDIEFWNAETGVTTSVETSYRQNRYSYGASDTFRGLFIVYPKSATGNRSRPYTFPINDPPSLSTLRWQIRMALNDVATEVGVDYRYPDAPKWADSELDVYAREAITFYSNFDRREYIISTTVGNLRPELFRDVHQVIDVAYYNIGRQEWLQFPQSSRRGRRDALSTKQWEMVGGTLKLYGGIAADVELEIHVTAPYKAPVNDYQEIDVSRDDWDILSLYAQGRAYLRLAGQSAQLDRWKEDGKRNDNPVMPVARLLIQEAETRLKDRRGPRALKRYRG